MDEQLGLTKIAGEYLEDKRRGKNIQHEMEGLLRQSVYSRLGGYVVRSSDYDVVRLCRTLASGESG